MSENLRIICLQLAVEIVKTNPNKYSFDFAQVISLYRDIGYELGMNHPLPRIKEELK